MNNRSKLLIKFVFLIIFPALVLFWFNSRAANKLEKSITSASAAATGKAAVPTRTATLEAEYSDIAQFGARHFWAVDKNGRVIHFSHGEHPAVTVSEKAFGGSASISFISASTGWAFVPGPDEPRLWKTKDGGVSWQNVKAGVSIPTLGRIRFVNEKSGWLYHGIGIWRTSDGGLNWEKVLPAYYPAPQISDVAILNDKSVMAVTAEGIHVTHNSGKSWQIGEASANASVVYLLDRSNAWALTFSNTVMRTLDGGRSWQDISKIDSPAKMVAINFISKLEGWAIGVDALPNARKTSTVGRSAPDSWGVLFRTSDGGKTWKQLEAPKDLIFTRVAFANSLSGWLMGHKALHRTIDGGQSWPLSIEEELVVGTPSANE